MLCVRGSAHAGYGQAGQAAAGCRCFGCADFMVQISRPSLGKQRLELEGKRADRTAGYSHAALKQSLLLKQGLFDWVFPLDLHCFPVDGVPNTSVSSVPSPLTWTGDE